LERFDRDLFENHLMGYAMRTDRYRLVLWLDCRDPQSAPFGTELYDLDRDPEENINLCGKHEDAELLQELSSRLIHQVKNGGRK